MLCCRGHLISSKIWKTKTHRPQLSIRIGLALLIAVAVAMGAFSTAAKRIDLEDYGKPRREWFRIYSAVELGVIDLVVVAGIATLILHIPQTTTGVLAVALITTIILMYAATAFAASGPLPRILL